LVEFLCRIQKHPHAVGFSRRHQTFLYRQILNWLVELAVYIYLEEKAERERERERLSGYTITNSLPCSDDL
jgi:prolipoprotein diacylglyceryltransferase